MAKNKMRLTRLFLWCLIGAALAAAIGVVTNLLTAEASWQAMVSKENRWLLFGLIGLVVLAALVAFLDSAENSSANASNQQQAITRSSLDQSQVMQGRAERDSYQIQNASSVVINQSSPRPLPSLPRAEIKNRSALLAKVNNAWIVGVLDRSLYNKARIALGLEDQPDRVKPPWQMEYRYANQRSPLPAGTRLMTKLQDLGEGATLLILGNPGSGKTTMLLELADDWLKVADPTNPDSPLPVVFNLSSWSQFRSAIPRQPPTLESWLVKELTSKYQIPPEIATAWITQQQLVLLLDGLDEVSEPRREDCLRAINNFSRDHGTTKMVVCCRIGDFEALQEALQFQAAVSIQPLNPTQIDAYLRQGGEKLRGIRTALQLNPDWHDPDPDSLRNLAETPLLLNIMALAYEGRSVETIQSLGAQNQRQALFDAYIERMFEQRVDHPCYLKEKAKWWLHRLASQLVKEGQTVFLIEYMQPKSWLTTKAERWQNRLNLGLTSGLFCGFYIGLFVTIFWNIFWGLSVGVFAGLGFAVSGSLFGGLNDIEPVESFTISTQGKGCQGIVVDILTLLFTVLLLGLTMGLAGWAMFSLLEESTLGLIGGLIFGFIAGFISSVTEFTKKNIQERNQPNQGIINSVKNSIFAILFSLVLTPLIYFLLPSIVSGILDPDAVDRLVVALIPAPILFGFMYGGGLALTQHLALRTTLFLNGHTPRNYAHFLNYAEERLFIQRVGGGYIFVHRLLLEHFATLEVARVTGGKKSG